MIINENSNQGYDRSQSSPEAIKKRSLRNQARRELEKQGKVQKGDGKHVHHKKPLSSGGSNTKRNLSITSAKKNHSEGGKIGTKTGKNQYTKK